MKGVTGVPTTITVNQMFLAALADGVSVVATSTRPSQETVTHARACVCGVCTTLRDPTANAASRVTLEMPHCSSVMSVCATFLAWTPTEDTVTP